MVKVSLLTLVKEHLRRITLEERIERNPVYPFHKVSANNANETYQLELRQNTSYYFLITTLLCVLSVVTCGVLGQYEYLVIFSFILLSCVYLTIEHWPMVRVVINHESGSYTVHRGGTLVHEGRLHNIALKMVEVGSSALIMHQIILQAYLLELDIAISYKVKNKDSLKHNAVVLSDNLGINYFDSHLPSKTHIVRHKREV